MFKNKTLYMILTGLALAFLLWLILSVLQTPKSDANSSDVNISGINPDDIAETPNANSALPPSVLGQFDHSPAGILSVTQSGSQFSLMGTGVSGAGISLLTRTIELARTRVDANGNWQLNFSYDFNSGPSSLDILMMTPDGHQIRSDQSLLIIPDPLGGLNQKESTFAPDTTPETDDEIIGSALLLLTAPGANSRVLQTPYGALPQENGFALEVIDYDNSGGVIFSGSANRPGKVRIFASDNLVGESHVDSVGRWSLIFGNIMPLGAYEISAELVIDDKPAVRLTLPFARMQPMFEAEASPKILVQHLDDRIQIGRLLFGGGYQYSVIYAPEALQP